MKTFDLIKVKADIICHGLYSSEVAEEIFKHQNPNEKHKQGRYFGVMIKLGKKVSVLANVQPETTTGPKYKLAGSLDHITLVDLKGRTVCEVSYIDPPKWYEKKTTSKKAASEIFIDEGENYLHMTYNGCDYYKCNLKCKFCGCYERANESTADEIAEVVEFAKDERAYQVCLGGGAHLPLQNNSKYFIDIIKKIRKKAKNIPIWVEMIPPTKPEIEEMVKAGATSFGFNIEVFDEKLRREICPGKSAVQISQYLERGEYANELLGGNRVGSTLICGIAPNKTIKNGIDVLTVRGIHPCILAFRPTETSEYKDKQECDSKSFYKCSKYAAEKMLENGLDIFKNEGCLRCEYCTIMHDLVREMKGE